MPTQRVGSFKNSRSTSSELKGGDAWDHHIRRQIADCALFVPIISAHTQARPEGYFRLEWDLADQRSHMIARTKAFVIPVCVDNTPDRGAAESSIAIGREANGAEFL